MCMIMLYVITKECISIQYKSEKYLNVYLFKIDKYLIKT